ncbi:MAG: response regulator [Flavobacteriales bacterium]|nr:response regulator [Flavobacteriales bacterium]
MKRQLNCVMLIDDEESTNFLSEMVLKQVGCAERIVVKQSAMEALDYLKSKEDGEHPQPNIIFLDINMPGMDGWEFLEKYRDLNKGEKGEIIVVMLTTSLNPADAEKAKGIEEIDAFRSKPLTREMLDKILEEHFED